jgi:hypothetical protein
VNELLRKRIDRHLENLTDDQGYLLLDFVEFLESKYGEETRKPSTMERISEGVEDAMRAGRLPVVAIRETMKAMDAASRMMQRLADAGQSAVNELNRSLATKEASGTVAAPDEGEPPPPATAEETAPPEAEKTEPSA